MKKIAAFLSASVFGLALLAFPVVAFAGANANCIVAEDGVVVCKAINKDTTKIKVKNWTWISNATIATADSGGCVQIGNDDGNTCDSGSATATATTTNTVNNNTTITP